MGFFALAWQFLYMAARRVDCRAIARNDIPIYNMGESITGTLLAGVFLLVPTLCVGIHIASGLE